MPSQRYQEFIAERIRLLERFKQLETENAELREGLAKNKIRNKIFRFFARKPPFILPIAGNFFGFASALLPAQQQVGQGGDVGN